MKELTDEQLWNKLEHLANTDEDSTEAVQEAMNRWRGMKLPGGTYKLTHAIVLSSDE